MTIYVDDTFDYGTFGAGGEWCHMATDNPDLEELHAFAKEIGLGQSWFQPHRTVPHYDLRPSKRKLAVKKGAVEMSRREMFTKCRVDLRNIETKEEPKIE